MAPRPDSTGGRWSGAQTHRHRDGGYQVPGRTTRADRVVGTRHRRHSAYPPRDATTDRAASASLVLSLARASSLVAACSGGTPPSFDPTGTCTADGRAPGAYPDLEALVPTTYEAAARARSTPAATARPTNLGSLADAGIDEVRFAGGTWTFGGNGPRCWRSSAPRD